MKGDFSRDTFDATKHFSRVLMQQGRVQIDADWNEQAAIQLYYLRRLAKDLIGPHWGTSAAAAFSLSGSVESGKFVAFDLSITGNEHDSYYVDGFLCENEATITYKSQSGFPFPDSLDTAEIKSGVAYLAYLDVWERDITTIEDDSIREKALGGPDTATRTKVVWQVKLIEYPDYDSANPLLLRADYTKFLAALGDLRRPGTGRLQVRAMKPSSADTTDPCNIPPKSNYRGENQFYLVEIHRSSTAATKATFTWSRDNGSAVFPVRMSAGATFTLESLSRGSRTLQQNDWVEVMDDTFALRGAGGLLLQVAAIDSNDMTVTLDVPSDLTMPVYTENDPRHPLLRLWDSPGELVVEVPTTNDGWIPLEDGIEVKFDVSGSCKSGDYWSFPARVATGDVEWPQRKGSDGKWAPAAVMPKGVIHHYAPLAIAFFDINGTLESIADQRRLININQLWH